MCLKHGNVVIKLQKYNLCVSFLLIANILRLGVRIIMVIINNDHFPFYAYTHYDLMILVSV